MKRRFFLLGSSVAASLPALARGPGTGSLSRPLFLHGPVTVINWADPHPHLEMLHRVDARAALRVWERITDTAGATQLDELLDDAVVPPADDRRWRVELPALARLSVAGVPRPKIGDLLDVLGSWRSPVTGTPTVDAQVFFSGGKAYPLPPVGSRV